MKNEFLNAVNNFGMTTTENGALTNKSTGSAIADQFGKVGCYRGRDIEEVFFDQQQLWNENPSYALRFPFYLRLITRKVKISDVAVSNKVQRGQGQRDEAFKRLLWIASEHPDSFYKNLWVLPLIGSWKDLWVLLYYDRKYNLNVLQETKVFDLLKAGFSSNINRDLIKKFMPRIKSSSKCHTDWTKTTNRLAKDFANYLHLYYVQYNHLKTSGTAHDFQKLICAGKYSDINWNLIPGRALSNLANGNFLSNHNLEKLFTDWIINSPSAKFTGYVYELGNKYRNMYGTKQLYKKALINKQFSELIDKAKADGKITSNVWCALDTSGSMSACVPNLNGNISAIDICVSLGLFFSELNKGAFHNNVIMFDDKSHVKELRGNTFTDKIDEIYNDATAWGSTNFQSVVDEIVRIRRTHPNIPLEDYPTTLLVISDMQFNPVNGYGMSEQTNYEAMKSKMYEVFPKDWVDSFKFIWWDCIGRKKEDFPAKMDDGGCYFFSGFDGSIVSLLLNDDVHGKSDKKPISMEEMIKTALTQEVLEFIKL